MAIEFLRSCIGKVPINKALEIPHAHVSGFYCFPVEHIYNLLVEANSASKVKPKTFKDEIGFASEIVKNRDTWFKSRAYVNEVQRTCLILPRVVFTSKDDKKPCLARVLLWLCTIPRVVLFSDRYWKSLNDEPARFVKTLLIYLGHDSATLESTIALLEEAYTTTLSNPLPGRYGTSCARCKIKLGIICHQV